MKASWRLAALLAFAFACAPGATLAASDAALLRVLPGAYVEDTMGEQGSNLLLRADGTFTYHLSLGDFDEEATGRWDVRNGHVLLTSCKAATAQYLLARAAGGEVDGTVAVMPGARMAGMHDVSVTLVGDEPVVVEAPVNGALWRAPFTGPVRKIVVQDEVIGIALPEVVAVPAAWAAHRVFRLDPNPGWQTAFAVDFDVDAGVLSAARSGFTMRWRRTAR